MALAGTSAPGTTGAPAVWSGHAFIIDLDNLPRAYSCQDLWYKFRGVLTALGARPDMSVTPYACNGRSPRVELQFLMPKPVAEAQARDAETRTTSREIHIAPGQPPVLKADDCRLIQLMQDELLSRLPVRVESDHFLCSAPGEKARDEFSLSVRAQMPVNADTRVATNGTPRKPALSATNPH
jgi:hypothetical protein